MVNKIKNALEGLKLLPNTYNNVIISALYITTHVFVMFSGIFLWKVKNITKPKILINAYLAKR